MTKQQFLGNQAERCAAISQHAHKLQATAPATTMHNHSLQRLVHRLTARLQQPGDHWFFLLYFGGLAGLLLLVSVLKLGIGLL